MQKYFDETVKTIQEMIRFDSSLKPAEEGAPFGKETAACLERFLAIARDMGFETRNYDNYIGEVVFGEGKDFAILAHLDVVPAGAGWAHDPFGGEISDGKIWGRGTMDDKGPAVCILYCLKALKDEGFTPKRKIKLILGCNEESGWACIEHYKKVATMPEEGFTPDANFPVIYAEKGIAHVKASFPLKDAPFTALTAGSAANMVCDSLTATLTDKAAAALKDAVSRVEGTCICVEGNTLTAKGKSAHGSLPMLGANALEAALRAFAAIDEQFAPVVAFLFDDCAHLKDMEDITGRLTMSPDVALFEDGALQVIIDFRYPATHKIEEIFTAFDAFGVSYESLHCQDPLFNDPEGETIQRLLSVWNESTGRREQPIAIGGGTYARALKCGCGFGPEVDWEESPIHQANEFISLKHIAFLNDLYYRAIKKISE